MSEKSEGHKNSSDFLRGICFGILLAGIAVLAFFLLRFGTIGSKKQEGAAILTSADTAAKLWQVREVIAGEYLGDVDSRLLEDYMFKGIAAGLNDPYAAYYTSEELEETERRNQGSYTGIGVIFAVEQEQTEGQEEERAGITVQTVYAGSPAEKAGIREGDVLLRVDDTDVREMDFFVVMDLVRDRAEEKVRLTFLRDGEEVTAECSEEEILLSDLQLETGEDGIGYVRIPDFTKTVSVKFGEILEEAAEQEVTGLILDVRDNPGGLLESVTAMLDDLLDDCVILSTSTKDERTQSIRSEKGKLFDGPVAVLVNGNSASASEVFAGVLQYYGTGYVIGETTFGKGVVQSTFEFRDGSALRLTTEQYFIAGEKSIDGTGITPDLAVEPEDEEDASAADLQLEAAHDYILKSLSRG